MRAISTFRRFSIVTPMVVAKNRFQASCTAIGTRAMRKQIKVDQSQQGFSLIELMMVIAIVGILASIAYPLYTNSVVKSNRAAAQSYLMELAQAQQKYFNDARAYAADEATLNFSPPDRVNSAYTIGFTVVAGPPPAFTVAATPRVGSRQDGDGVLAIDSSGAKTRSGDAW